MKKLLSLLALQLLIFSSLFSQVNNDQRILLQGFFWESAADHPNNWYNHVNSKISTINNAGIDMIWLPPPSDAGSLEGYLPRELNNFNNNYGSLSEHQNLLTNLGNNGIDAIADIVINHRVGSTNWYDFKNPDWGTDAIANSDEVFQEFPNLWPRGGNDTGTPYSAARDIDHTKVYVRNSIKQFLNNLKAIGYDGWRYDFVHGFAPQYIAEYNGATNPTFSVGENWNQNKQVIQDWIDNVGSTTAFDFSTYYSLKGAIKDNNYSYLVYQGAASGGIGWDPRRYTTFVENHDTPDYDPSNNALNGGNVGRAYAYLLTHPGVPTIYWPHMFEWGTTAQNQIVALSQLRKSAGIHSQSQLTILSATASTYAARVKGNNRDVIVKIGYGGWSPQSSGIAGNWVLETSGNDYAVWSLNNSSSSMTVYVQNFSTIYAWTGSGSNVNQLTGSWPGQNLQNAGNGWKKYTLPVQCSNVIFSHNGSSQTADLYACGPNAYFQNNQWNSGIPAGASRIAKEETSVPFSVSPNPINDSKISFSIDQTEEVHLSIISMSGKSTVIINETLKEGTHALDLNEKTIDHPGIYTVALRIGKTTNYQKVIVQ